MFFDPLYLLFLAPGMLLAFWAQAKVKSTFERYSQVRTRGGVTGAEVARVLLRARGLHDVRVERVEGYLSDHYDPTARTVRLSPKVYDSDSIAALGVAAHETGHALQHADAYAPLQFRSAIVPIAQFGSQFSWILLIAGAMLMFLAPALGKLAILAGLLFFAASTLFSMVTLPVEIDASRRALALLSGTGILVGEENEGARKTLNAAAYTYVAALIVAVLQLAYFVIRYLPLVFGGNND